MIHFPEEPTYVGFVDDSSLDEDLNNSPRRRNFRKFFLFQ